jgi:hypothetical protein
LDCAITIFTNRHKPFIIKAIYIKKALYVKSLIQIEHPLDLDLEISIAMKNPTAVLPRPDGVLIQPALEGSSADAGHQPAAGDFSNQVLTT